MEITLIMTQWPTLIGIIIINIGMITTIVLSLLVGVSKLDITLFLIFYIMSGFGITLGYHRYFTHRSFKTYRIVEYILCLFGSLAGQGSLAFWVGKHRIHHHFTDTMKDPHSPVAAAKNKFSNFFHAHMGWLFVDYNKYDYKQRVKDIIKNERFNKFQQLYWLWFIIGLLVPTVLGGVISQSWQGALTGFLWGGVARVCVLQHITWAVNSVCHLFGSRLFKSSDNSKNNFLVALVSFGEGFHNNHHAFAYSARHGLKTWQIDVTYLLIKMMEKLGLAWNIKLPTMAAIKNKLRAPSSL